MSSAPMTPIFVGLSITMLQERKTTGSNVPRGTVTWLWPHQVPSEAITEIVKRHDSNCILLQPQSCKFATDTQDITASGGIAFYSSMAEFEPHLESLRRNNNWNPFVIADVDTKATSSAYYFVHGPNQTKPMAPVPCSGAPDGKCMITLSFLLVSYLYCLVELVT